MKKFKYFDYLSPMLELPGRDDLSHVIMNSLDYNIAGQSRLLLGKSLTASSKVVRYLATKHLRVLLRAGVASYSTWGVTFLVKQLCDSDVKVAQVALNVLDEACDDEECLETLIQKRPNLLEGSLGRQGRDLMFRFLSLPSGYNLLSETSFITDELNNWKKSEYITYMVSLEHQLQEAFSSTVWRSKSDTSDNVVYLPPHFYGELTKTQQGGKVFRDAKHLEDFLACIQNPNSKLLERRAALLVLGHLGTSQSGVSFLVETKAIPIIVNLAENSPILSIRGTAFYVLGMLSRTEEGRHILDSLGWESPADETSYISIPKDPKTCGFFKVPEYEYKGSIAKVCPDTVVQSYADARDEILNSTTELSNHITSESGSRALRRLKDKNAQFFTSTLLMWDVYHILETYHFRATSRRFIYDVFANVTYTLEDFQKFA